MRVGQQRAQSDRLNTGPPAIDRANLVADETWAISFNLGNRGMAAEDGPRLSLYCVSLEGPTRAA